MIKEERCLNCPCTEVDGCRNIVGGRGDSPADVVFVGEGPGERERDAGNPFSGESGNLLHMTWQQVTEDWGTQHLTGYETNAYLCFPDSETQEQDALRVCKRRLYSTLEQLKPKFIVAMGGGAVQALLGKEKVIPHLWKPQVSPFLHFPHTVLVTFNPASPLRNPGQYRTFAECLEFVARRTAGVLPTLPDPETFIAQDLADVRQFLQKLQPYNYLSLDLETTRLDPFLDQILTLILSPITEESTRTRQYQTYIIPWRLITENVEVATGVIDQQPREGFQEVKDFLETLGRAYLAHNAAFDQNFLLAGGIRIVIKDDPMLLHYAMDERTDVWAGHGLKPRCTQYLGAPDWEGPIWSYLKKRSDSFANVPEEVLHQYCQFDTPYAAALLTQLGSQADATELALYRNQLLPMREMLADQQARGVYIDIPILLTTRNEVVRDVEKLDSLLQDICGLPLFNPGSTFEVQDILFKDFGLVRPEKDGVVMAGSGEPVLLALLKQNQGFLREVARLDESDEVSTLTELVTQSVEIDHRYAFVLGILVRRDAGKDITTYFDGVAKFISPWDRCIHPFFHIPGTDTGRFTGSRPSLLNVKNANRVKMPYGARPGYVLGYADQAQFELRVFACRAGDTNLAQMLRESDRRTALGEKADIHTLVGKMVFPYYDQAPKWWRAIVKTIVFGVLYGRTAYAIAKKHNIDPKEAESHRSRILDLFPMVREYEGEIIREVRANHCVETPFGRRKRFPFLPRDKRAWTHIKNAAGNMPIQSIAADLNSLSMLDIWKERHETDIHPLFSVHDSILFEIPKNRIQESLAHISEVMTTAPVRHLGDDYKAVDFSVDPQWGHHWGEISEEEGFFAQVMALVDKE